MINSNSKSLHTITFLIILLSLIASLTGLIYTTAGESHDFVNQYGDTVNMYGSGLYEYDSSFVVPIFRGTDFTILFIAIPLLIIALLLDMKKNTMKYRLLLTSVISAFTYYAASIAFGVTYNSLHLVYIALFSASIFGLIVAIASLDKKQLEESISPSLKYKGIYRFLVITGIALTIAWLPDIISALLAGRPLLLIETYTTSVTNILDIGIITPVAFIALSLLKKRKGMGYILLGMLLTTCVIMGIMLPIQSVFQTLAGITIPVPALVIKVGIFVALAVFAFYFNFKLFKNIKT